MLTCKHCGREISDSIPAVHLAGSYAGKARCNPEDSGLMYGYNAEPTGAECAYPCLGFREADDA